MKYLYINIFLVLLSIILFYNYYNKINIDIKENFEEKKTETTPETTKEGDSSFGEEGEFEPVSKVFLESTTSDTSLFMP